MFDAVNGIERRYTPIHVMPAAPRGASKRAAAVQAAYASLIRLFPSQTMTFQLKRAVSMQDITTAAGANQTQSIKDGVTWGQTVADAIWVWRSEDGFSDAPPAFMGGTAPGEWRPTPPGHAAGLAPQLAHVTPWAIASPAQFRPSGPPTLTSDQYTADFNEIKMMGSANSASRTADQTLYANFWQSTSPVDFWDPVATTLSAGRNYSMSENARMLALLNMGLADAIIGCWDAKYAYTFWRPVTAITLADTSTNPATTPDASWTPLIVTPPFPEYPCAHSCVSAAAARILSSFFGESAPSTVAADGTPAAVSTFFNVTSDAMPGVVRHFSSFTAALEEVKNARVFGGIHFRTACVDGQALGTAIGDYILNHTLLPVN